MELKTFRAHTMADALAEVKKDLGRDAVILHTRTYKVGGLLGVGAKNVVEITASDGANAPPNTHRPRAPRTAPSHFSGPVPATARTGCRPPAFRAP